VNFIKKREEFQFLSEKRCFFWGFCEKKSDKW